MSEPFSSSLVKPKILIFGSCVTRDAIEFAKERCTLSDYLARSSIGSAFAEVCAPKKVVERISNNPSKFQQRMLTGDLLKSAGPLINSSDYDILVIDFIDERFDLFVFGDGGICTLSNELLSTGFRRADEQGNSVASGSEEFFNLWERGWVRLVAQLREAGALERVRINKVFWADRTLGGKTYAPSYSQQAIYKANEFLRRLYARVKLDVPERQWISVPSHLQIGADEHRWGLSPFHYIDGFYVDFLWRLEQTLGNPGPRIQEDRQTVVLSSTGLTDILDVDLARGAVWCDVQAKEGSAIVVESRLSGGAKIKANNALVMVDFGEETNRQLDVGKLGFARSPDPTVGVFRYLATGPGCHEGSISFRVPSGCRRFRLGVRGWCANDSLKLERLCVRESRVAEATTMISVDVEALPGRASDDLVERLIFGNFGGGQQRLGIERICDIFDEFGIRATFFVDYACCAVHGDSGIFRASDLILNRGHEVQLHMHSEVLVRHKNWNHNPGVAPTFANIDKDLACQVLEYGIEKFERNLGRPPRIFRPGGMQLSQNMFRAMKEVGVEAASAFFRRDGTLQHLWPKIADKAVFQWSNGVKEMPLDFALDPLVEWRPFEKEVERIRMGRPVNATSSVLLHSTSLLRRERIAGAIFEGGYPPYEEQLRAYLGVLSKQGGFATFGDVLTKSTDLAQVPIEELGGITE